MEQEQVEDAFHKQGVSIDMLECLDQKATLWYSQLQRMQSTAAGGADSPATISDRLREAMLGFFLPRVMGIRALESDQWNKVCELFDAYCKLAPKMAVPEMVPNIFVTLCHILWKTNSVSNRKRQSWCPVAVQDLGRWLMQQGHTRNQVPVTQGNIIQLEKHIVQALGWHLDPPTVIAATQNILQRLTILTQGQCGNNAVDLKKATNKYAWAIVLKKAHIQYPIVKLARGAVALSLASERLLPIEGRASILPESAQHAWNQICKVAFGTETFLEDMVDVKRFLDGGRTATSTNHGDAEVRPGRSHIQDTQTRGEMSS